MVFNPVDSLLNRFSTLNGISLRCIPVIYTRLNNIKNVKQQTSCEDPGLVAVGINVICSLLQGDKYTHAHNKGKVFLPGGRHMHILCFL